MSRPASQRPRPLRIVSHLGVMVAVAAVMGVIVAGLAIPFAGVVGIGARNVAQSMEELPEELETERLPERSRIVDGEGNLIANIYSENRKSVELTQVAPIMRKAILAIEDYRFYQHGALDLRGTLRALVTNQASGDQVQGGSSITQQMVKLTLVQQADTPEERQAATDDTYARKLRELRYAIAFEENYDKNWILERYLNIAYFGNGAYGIQAASQAYFDKPARKLNVREAATLAGLVRNPTGYDPTNSPDRSLQRRNVVLNRMAELGVIEPNRADRVKKQGLGLDETSVPNGCVSSDAAFFCDYVLKYLEDDPSLGDSPEERREFLLTGGLTIRTTIDQRFQAATDAAVRTDVFQTDPAIGALASVVPGTGEVRAISQSRPMGSDREAGETYLNYVVPQRYGDSNGFQPGSTFKLFVVAAALNQGMSPTEVINSPDTYPLNLSSFETCDGPYQSSEVYSPSNSTPGGAKTMYTGTQESVNTYFWQLEQRTGICEPYELAQQMGVELDNPENEMVPTFTLGVADVSPLEMAEAYATFAARGTHCASRPITDIRDAAGTVLKTYESDCEQVLPESTADTINDILRGVMEGGFGSGVQIGQPSAAKTGTTQDGKAVWFNGYTPQLATAAMIAGANEFGQPIPMGSLLIGGAYRSVSGSGFAGPMWGAAMSDIAQYLPDDDFAPPGSAAE